MERKVVRTMIMVTVFYVICWFPVQIFFSIYAMIAVSNVMEITVALSAIAYLNIVVSPVVYGTHFNAPRRALVYLKDRLYK